MRYARFILIATFIVLVFPVSATAQDAVNAGFVEGLWYSEKPIFAGETVRIYAALRNNTESDLTGTVTFKDGNSVISEKEVSALSGRLIETWADWTPTYGEHTISAELHDVTLHSIGEDSVQVNAESGVSESFVFVDRDTDGDGIGDREDTDDDNDGVSDAEEAEQGTDPLTPNVPVDESESDETTEQEDETNDTQENQGDTDENQAGFEKHFDGGVHTILSNVTKKVNESKATLDAYRAERNAEKERAEEGEESTQATSSDMIATTTATATPVMNTATITRTQFESEGSGFIGTISAGIVGIFDALYTLLLWIISTVLGRPGLVQLLLLITILFSTYKLAKWYGARRRMQ